MTGYQPIRDQYNYVGTIGLFMEKKVQERIPLDLFLGPDCLEITCTASWNWSGRLEESRRKQLNFEKENPNLAIKALNIVMHTRI